MRGLGIGLCGSGTVFLVASWVSRETRGEPNYTAAIVGMVCCIAGAVVMARRYTSSR